MKNLFKILIPVVTLIIFGSFANTASAVTPLTVSFDPNPLFKDSNFMPGDNKEANITIDNNSDSTQSAYIEGVNVFNDDGLADQMNLEIFEGPTEIYNDNFETFLKAGPVLLSDIGASAPKTYNLKVTFIESTDNDYQGKTLGFDICVGFSGGESTCTNTVTVGPETPPGSGGGGGGGLSGGHHLTIFNEEALNILSNGTVAGSGSATIVWNTNIPATSQVIYGLASGAPYPFDINIPPSFGYPSVNVEDMSKVTNHSMLITGLTPGETYVYRVVSRASPPTISHEHKFTVPIPSVLGISNTGTGALGSEGVKAGGAEEGSVLGANSENKEESGFFGSKNLGAVVDTGLGGLVSKCSLIALLILLVAYLVWKFVLRSKYEKKGLSENKIKEKFFTFFGFISGASIIVALLIGQVCPIPIFAVALLVSIGLCIYYRYYSQKTL